MAAPSALLQEGSPTDFQQACAQRVVDTLSKHLLEPTPLVLGDGSPSWYWSSFQFEHKEHRVEIYPKIVVMHQGERYFECYMPEEFVSEQTLIDGFATRLDRYLSSGPWARPDEKGFAEAIKAVVRRPFRR